MNAQKKKLAEISKMVDENRNTPKEVLWEERQARFKELTRKHGIECTALAAGLTVSSLSQYLRVTDPKNIGGGGLALAEEILSKFE